MDPRFSRYPIRYPQNVQVWQGTPQYPYPMNFTDAPSFGHQVLINYNGRPMLQGLDTVRGPFMFPVKEPMIFNPCGPITYPITHSVPSPYQQMYIGLASGRRCV